MQATFSAVDKGDPRFYLLLKTLVSLTRELHRSAIKNSAKMIKIEHERLLWEKELLGMSIPKMLQRTVLFYA